jgi:hypothetical protein
MPYVTLTGQDQRGMKERYFYFVRGRQFVILEWKNTPDYSNFNAPSYQAPSGGADTLDGDNLGETGLTEALLVEYTAIPELNEILSEQDSIPVANALDMAVVDYVKSRLVEDPNDFKKKEYYLAKFRERVTKYARVKTGGSRTVQPMGHLR